MRALSAIIVIVFLSSCANVAVLPYSKISGKTMGTTYNIILQSDKAELIQDEIDQLLVEINDDVSTYIDTSSISLFNQNYSTYLQLSSETLPIHFAENLKLSKQIHKNSDGAFEPTVMPVVNYWGFGYTGKNKVTEVDSTKISQIMNRVGISKVTLAQKRILKSDTLVELDFSGVAKGYGVDKISEFLLSKGILNHYVEIGGEVFATGVNAKGEKWRTGVTTPSPDATTQDFQKIIEVEGRGIATSGNYRNFYEADGEIYSHTINPRTGFPERNSLLSATILAPSCALADGYATACMVMGLNKSIEMITLLENVDAILIYSDEEGNFRVFDSTKK